MKKFFLNIFRFFEVHKGTMWGILAFLVISCAFSALKIQFEEDISNFLPNNEENQRINYAYEHIGAANKIIVSIGQNSGEKEMDYDLLSSAATLFAEKLQEHNQGENIHEILYQIDQEQIDELTTFVIDNMPYFLEEDDYQRFDSLLSPAKIEAQLENDKQLLAAPVATLRNVIQHDPMFFSAGILQSLNDFRPDDNYQTIDGFFYDQSTNEALVIVTSKHPASETKNNAVVIRQIRECADFVTQNFDNQIYISSFGVSEIAQTNARQIKKDSLIAIGLSLIFIITLLLYYYRNVRSILLILLSTLMGGLFAIGIISLVKSTVSVIAIGVASIIIGIAINYPIHLLSHFKRTDNKEQIIKDIVSPLLIGNITTVGAFISLLFISSDAMKDLGLFAALLLIGTILFVLVFLPHLLGKTYPNSDRSLAFKHIAEFKPESHPIIIISVILLSVVLYHFSLRTSFDTNMHHINYMTQEQRTTLERMMAQNDSSRVNLYCIAEGESIDEALSYNEQIQVEIRNLHSKDIKASGIGNFIPSKSQQKEKIERWNLFWKDKKDNFEHDLDIFATKTGFNPAAFQAFKDILSQDFQIQEADYFDLIKNQMATNYISEEDGHILVYNILNIPKNEISSVEQSLNHLDSHIFAFTESSIATRLVQALSKDFDYVLFICGFIVFAFLLISFGRFEISLMAFTPLVVAWIWILGIMGLFHIQFNIVNIILATFIFGMGDDYSIFVTEGLIYEYTYGKKMLSQFKNSIILSAFIMFIGIGMLIFAKHPAMKSLAEVTIVGMFSVVLMAYVIPPFIFRWLTQKKGEKRRQPITISNLSRTIFSFTFFIFGSIFLSIASFFMLTLRGKSEKHKLQYHRLLQQTMRFVAWGMPQVKHRIDNPHQEDFSKPAVIICNHQSHFDLVYTLMLSPKIIALTNKWAWKNPFYRGVIRGADFLPIYDGIEQHIGQLKALTDKGYSILIFPEGTRSEDCNILRFHKGAFLLANELQLDILPLVIHGAGHVLPKKEMLMRKGKVTLSIEKRISPDDQQYRQGRDLLSTAKIFRQFYIEKYQNIAQNEENARYFLDFVRHNYIYKGREVYRECKTELKDIQKLEEEANQLPESGEIVIKNCSQGEKTLLFALIKKNLHIIAQDPDQDKIDIAQNCAGVPNNLTYQIQNEKQ